MRAGPVLAAVPIEPAELDERESVCPRCRLVVLTEAHTPEACDR